MTQFSNADRKTIVLRVPRKYRSLIRAYCIWLKLGADQAALWNVEEKLSQAFEQNWSDLDIACEYRDAMNWLRQPKRGAG